MSKWIYSKNGKQYGPVSAKQLANIVLTGELDVNDSILSVKSQMWQKIKDTPQIMDIVYQPMPGNYFSDLDKDEFESYLTGEAPADREPLFFNFPWQWLLVLQILSFGSFQLYWIIRQLKHTEKRRRSFLLQFPVVMLHIFRAIDRDKTISRTVRHGWTPGMLSAVWLSALPLLIVGSLSSIPALKLLLSYPIVIMLTSLSIIPAQKTINEANEKLGKRKSSLGVGFYFYLLLCAILVFFIIRSRFWLPSPPHATL